jgi:putative transposase
MPRHRRAAAGGYVYHCLNRAVARLPLFQKDGDYEAFERVLVAALEKHPIRLLAYCLMPNHWHFVLWPERDGQVTEFLRWLTHTHTQRWHAHYHTSGSGHLYQGRFKAFPIQQDDHLYTVLRYVERNSLRADLVSKVQEWRWSSVHQRLTKGRLDALLAAWPVPMPRDWLARVQRPETEAELEAVRRAVQKGQPYGSATWQHATAKTLGLQFTLRQRGRPKKEQTKARK